MAPKRKSRDVDNSDMPKRSHKVYIGVRFGTIHGFGHPLEVLEFIGEDKGGATVLMPLRFLSSSLKWKSARKGSHVLCVS